MDIKTCTWLLEDSIDVEVTHRVAVLFADDPAFVFYLTQSVAQVDVYDISHARLAYLAEELTDAANLSVLDTVFPAAESDYDSILMLAMKGRQFDRALMWAAYHALRPDGALYIAGSTREGAKAVVKDAGALFGASHTLTYKRSHRVGMAVRPESVRADLPRDWGDVPLTGPHRRTFTLPDGVGLPVATMPGVFSWEALDDGTAYLLEHIDWSAMDAEHTVLDIGCGSGVLGTVAAGHASAVTLADDNLLAVRCARLTLAYNNCTSAQVIQSDVYSALQGRRYDWILCNPPFHQSFEVDTNVAHRVIREAADHLTPGGRLLLVCNSFLKYEEAMEAHFRYVRVVAQSDRYKVLEGRIG